ncbi:MAG: hypothetical protein ACTS41_01225 [Candidatus Hodgkinia cicadicola]
MIRRKNHFRRLSLIPINFGGNASTVNLIYRSRNTPPFEAQSIDLMHSSKGAKLLRSNQCAKLPCWLLQLTTSNVR